ncbi:MAG TPA: reverse transcriptase domain-containing protein, partial [Streptosporangiaceae bacterium]|nr:reverse transcriptase domain-containing protein [Streptosporangiaceae bacterium]
MTAPALRPRPCRPHGPAGQRPEPPLFSPESRPPGTPPAGLRHQRKEGNIARGTPAIGVASTPNAYQGSLFISKPAQNTRSRDHANRHRLNPWCCSYGYRPERGALDAVAACRKRCWEYNWVIDLDIRKFFDSVRWDLIVKAVEAHTSHETRWVVLYVKRWLAAALQLPDGTL